jgi:hypothetical protein
MTTAAHVFELSHNGKAPFRCVGVASIPSPSLAEQNPTAYNNALAMLPKGIGCGSCAHCGTAIMHNYIIVSSEGNKFVVGSECVMKTGDAGLIATVKAERSRMAAEKREVRRNTNRAEREASWKAEREANAKHFAMIYADLITKAQPHMQIAFIKDVIEGGLSGRFISDKAISAVARVIESIEQRAIWKANSRHTGTVGKRQTFNVVVDRIASYERPSFAGYGYDRVWIVTMRDEAGNAIVSKSTAFCPDQGANLTIKATVKEHSSYDGEQQTIVQRIKVA